MDGASKRSTLEVDIGGHADALSAGSRSLKRLMPDSHKRILIVEDDIEVRTMISSVLRQRGLAVDEASGGQEAIDLVRAKRYAVILLDLLMPQPNGFDVLDELESPQTPPVVLVVTGADRSVIDQLDSERIHGIVRKPFDPDDLAALVVACAEIRSRGNFRMMAMAVISGARFFDFLIR